MFLYQERRLEDDLKLMSRIEEIAILAVQVERFQLFRFLRKRQRT